MSASPAKILQITLMLTVGASLPVISNAQDLSQPGVASGRAASFLSDAPSSSAQATPFSGLASLPPISAPTLGPDNQATNDGLPAAPAPRASSADPGSTTAPPVLSAPPSRADRQAGVNESTSAGDQELGSASWKGTTRGVAQPLLALASVTTSPLLNRLALRAMRADSSSSGVGEPPPVDIGVRAEKMVAFDATPEAWSLLIHSDPKQMDDTSVHFVAENMLASDSENLCAQLAAISQTYPGVDWQEIAIICQLRSKDTKVVQASLEAMRAQPRRDDIFLQIVDKNILADGKTLPHQLTPLTATLLSLLRLTNLPLPGELYGHPDFALTDALVRSSAKEDVAELGFAERAASRGLISAATLGGVYKSVIFSPDELTAPLNASQSGSKLRALLYQAATAEKNPSQRIAYAVKFIQSSPPELLNGVGDFLGQMLGTIKQDPATQDNAAEVAHIYMLADRGDAALEWLKLARTSSANAEVLHNLWPQFALAGLESEAEYADHLDKWLTGGLSPLDGQTDLKPVQEKITNTLLLMEAAGLTVPDSAWAKIFALPHTERRVNVSSLLFERLGAAAFAGRRGETVLTAVDLAGESDISMVAAVAITRALRQVGLKTDAAIFARQIVATLDKI